MTPEEREKLELEIYFEIKKHSGAIHNASDYLRHKDDSRVSRIVNPNDSRANNIFGEVSDLLEAFHYKHPDLEKFIWGKLTLRRNAYIKPEKSTEIKLLEIADKTTREQLDVNFAIGRRATQEELEHEALQALQRSQAQYDAIVSMRSKSIPVISESEQ